MLLPKSDIPFSGNLTLESVDVIKFFQSHGRKLALHESLYKPAIYKYIVSDYLTGRLIVNSKTKAGAFRDAEEIMKQAIDKNHDFGQYVEYNGPSFQAGVIHATKIMNEENKAFVDGVAYKLSLI